MRDLIWRKEYCCHTNKVWFQPRTKIFDMLIAWHLCKWTNLIGPFELFLGMAPIPAIWGPQFPSCWWRPLQPLPTPGESRHSYLGFGFHIGWETSYTQKSLDSLSLWGPLSPSTRDWVLVSSRLSILRLVRKTWKAAGRQRRGSILQQRLGTGPKLFLSCATLAVSLNLSDLVFSSAKWRH